MLKIKDVVDLKKLKNFGFKPKYNEDTGKIERYIYNNSMVINIKDRKMYPFRKCNEYSEIDLEYFKADFVEEALYDLIKADLVEKVGE